MGSTRGAIHRRWKNDSRAFSPDIANSISATEFAQTKRILKMNDNNADDANRSHSSYNPAHKFDLPYNCLQFNTVALTAKGAADTCLDETTCADACSGPAGDSLVKRARLWSKYTNSITSIHHYLYLNNIYIYNIYI